MEELSTFDHLVRQLGSAERREMLVRLQGVFPAYPVELAPASPEEEAPFVPEQELARLGFLRRLLLLLTALLTRRDRSVLLKALFLRRLAERIRAHNDTLIDFRTGRFRPGMYTELARLRESAALLRALLEDALGGEKRAFIAFLAREELPEFQSEALRVTDPDAVWEESGHPEERALRSELMRRLRRLLEEVPEEEKRRLYRDTGALYSLRVLSALRFEELLARARERCPLRELLGPLGVLAEGLSLVHRPPSPQALYDLVLFHNRERLEEDGRSLDTALAGELTAARDALTGIREFHRRVPLLSILRYASGDPNYIPHPGGAGEDWFLLFQEFWQQRVEQRYLRFVFERRRGALLESCQEALGGTAVLPLENYHSNRFGADTPVRHELSLAFLAGFARAVFPVLYRPLKLIYLNGEFFKEENRRAFTDAFHFLGRLEERIGTLEERLGPRGDLRAAIQTVRNEKPPQRIQARKIRDLLGRADLDARGLTDQSVLHLQGLVHLLQGILSGKPGDRYDTLANLKTLGGRENRALFVAWEQALEQSRQVLALLEEIRDLESRTPG